MQRLQWLLVLKNSVRVSLPLYDYVSETNTLQKRCGLMQCAKQICVPTAMSPNGKGHSTERERQLHPFPVKLPLPTIAAAIND